MLSLTPTSSEPTPITNMPTDAFLPEEITLNILKRLPVKSLKRFQCVSKQWNTLIKTPSFIQHHLHHHTHHDPSLVVGPQFSSEHDFSLLSCHQNMQLHELHIPPFLLSLKRLSIEASCNGLLFLLRWGKHNAYPLLWNPATREVTEITLICVDFSDSESDVDLNWDATFGFGFSPVSNDYKIVRLLTSFFMVDLVEVYSVRGGRWRAVTYDNLKGVSVNCESVSTNGVIFWFGSMLISIEEFRKVIVAFDIETEVFTVIPLPPLTTDSHQLVVYDDKLAIISYVKYGGSRSFPLYFRVLEDGGVDSSGERWSLSEKYIGSFGSKLLPMTIWRNQIVSVHSGMENVKHLSLIDVSTNECKRFDIPEFKDGVRVLNYVESLVPIGGDLQIGDLQIEEP